MDETLQGLSLYEKENLTWCLMEILGVEDEINYDIYL
ncbi:hypothetical protein Gotri_014041, partial [Gossypium trilobum]|nr:hypothetical protein [Gossypium trilobum]